MNKAVSPSSFLLFKSTFLDEINNFKILVFEYRAAKNENYLFSSNS